MRYVFTNRVAMHEFDIKKVFQFISTPCKNSYETVTANHKKIYVEDHLAFDLLPCVEDECGEFGGYGY